jgi:hypothetical protein
MANATKAAPATKATSQVVAVVASKEETLVRLTPKA